jgi:Protein CHLORORESPIRATORY REDUCTION 7
MSSRSLYSEDHYIVLETNHPEEILEVAQLETKLFQLLQKQPDLIPSDLRHQAPEEQVRSLLDTVCELDMGADQYLQWYAIRLEK